MIHPPLWLDTETYNVRDIRVVGGYEHARTCELMLLQYALGEGPVTVVDVANGDPIPQEFFEAFADVQAGRRLAIAHNAQYDRWVVEATLRLVAPIEHWRDSMVRAYEAALPGALDDLCQAVGLGDDLAKIRDGKRLIQLFCKPAPGNHKVDRYTRDNRPDEWARFIDYARRDVEAMRAAWHRIPNWNYTDREHALWVIDQRSNDAGLPVDVDSAQIAVDLIERLTDELNAELAALTGGEVAAASAVEKLKQWIANALGEDMLDLTANSVTDLLKRDDLPPQARRALEIRQQGARASGKKYSALVDKASPDGTLKGAFQLAGAYRTRRWAGRGFQPQNLLRPIIKDLEAGIEAIRNNLVDLLYDDPMGVVGSCVRAVIAAPPGKCLAVSDLSGIEGRVLPWLARFQAKLDRIRGGVDEYKRVAATIYRCHYEDVADDSYERLVGKVGELACGYQGSLGAYQSMAENYDLTVIENHYDAYQDEVPPGRKTLYRRKDNDGEVIVAVRDDTVVIPDGLFLGSFEVLQAVRAWREENAPIVSFWYDCEDAAREAIRNPGRVYEAGRVKFCLQFHEHGDYKSASLLAALPSGSYVIWPGARLDGDKAGGKPKISYMGPHPVSGKWCRLSTYGGKIVENLTQAEARNVMAWNIPAIVEAGFDYRGSVHDEVITLVDEDSHLDDKRLSELLAANPPWATDLPLNAKGYTSKRYRK